ncbi:MAG: hypothetical protein AB7I09_01565 [Planctomycetota bacterium]
MDPFQKPRIPVLRGTQLPPWKTHRVRECCTSRPLATYEQRDGWLLVRKKSLLEEGVADGYLAAPHRGCGSTIGDPEQ